MLWDSAKSMMLNLRPSNVAMCIWENAFEVTPTPCWREISRQARTPGSPPPSRMMPLYFPLSQASFTHDIR